MKRFAFVILASLSFTVLGCKPDAAVKRGEVIDEGPSASHKQAEPLSIGPKIDKENPVKQVK